MVGFVQYKPLHGSLSTGLSCLHVLVRQGEEWHKMRSPMSKFMMVPKKVAEYHEGFNNITLDLLKNIDLKKHPDTAMLTDAPSHLFKWSFECKTACISLELKHVVAMFTFAAVTFFVLGKRLGALSENGATPETQEYIATVGRFFVDLTDLLFALPLYKVYRTKLWKSVVNDQVTLQKLSMKMINKKLAEIEEKDRQALEAASGEEVAPEKVDFITYMVHSGKMSLEELSAIVIDLLSAGVETVI